MRRRRISRRQRLGSVIQSYKQIRQDAPLSVAAATRTDYPVTTGVDNYTGPSASNNEVPTGAKVEKISIQISQQNLVNIAGFIWISVQLVRANQTVVDPRALGGNPQRNQVFLQIMRSLGQNQNTDIAFTFKIPAKFQRVREGDKWYITNESDVISTKAMQTIYKFYR